MLTPFLFKIIIFLYSFCNVGDVISPDHPTQKTDSDAEQVTHDMIAVFMSPGPIFLITDYRSAGKISPSIPYLW